MIAEIALQKPEKANGAEPLIKPATDADFIVDTVKQINETPLSELEARLPEFIQRRHQNAFVLGGVLERIRREKFWNPGSRQPKNALFERWVEDTCHYSGRKARYLISVYVGLVAAAIPSSKVSDVGWSKLRTIAPLIKTRFRRELRSGCREQNSQRGARKARAQEVAEGAGGCA